MEVTVQAIGASPSLNEYESGSAQFQVTNWTGFDGWFTFDCSHSGKVVDCTDPSDVYIEDSESETVWVEFEAGSAGSGSVTLEATHATEWEWDYDVHSVTVTIGSEPPGPPPSNWDVSAYNCGRETTSWPS
jgi:hypothetical protein